MTPLESVCRHEAGHAVVSLAKGYKPVRTFVYANHQGHACGRHVHSTYQQRLGDARWNRLSIVVAGHMGDWMSRASYSRPRCPVTSFCEVQRRHDESGPNDQLQAWQNAKALCCAPELFTFDTFVGFVDLASKDAERILAYSPNWMLLERIAGRLRQLRVLEPADYQELIGVN